jgi:hypothetical protein
LECGDLSPLWSAATCRSPWEFAGVSDDKRRKR